MEAKSSGNPELLERVRGDGGARTHVEGFAAPYPSLKHPYSAFRQSRLRVCCKNWQFGQGTFAVFLVPVNRRNVYATLEIIRGLSQKTSRLRCVVRCLGRFSQSHIYLP